VTLWAKPVSAGETHDVKPVSKVGRAALKNGDRLARAERDSEAFVAVNRSSKTWRAFDLGHCAACSNNRAADLRRLAPDVLAVVSVARRGEVMRVGGDEGA
jgi:hypothetical protein